MPRYLVTMETTRRAVYEIDAFCESAARRAVEERGQGRITEMLVDDCRVIGVERPPRFSRKLIVRSACRCQ